MFKKLVIIISLFACTALMAQQGYKIQNIKNGSDTTATGAYETNFMISSTESDTSRWFHMYDRGSMKFYWNDPDSAKWKAELYTSSQSLEFDSTYSLAQTIVAAGDTGLVSTARPVFAHPEPYGILIITGLAGNTVADTLQGSVIYTGTSNQAGAVLTKFMGRR